MTDARPLILSCPLPRTLPLMFADGPLAELRARYRIVETTYEELPGQPDEVLAQARYIIGQPPLTEGLLARLSGLRCIFNVESNLLPNMPYDAAFARGIHVVTTGAVFCQPVAEIGLGFALSLARNIHGADADFGAGRELWGSDGNRQARLLAGSEIGIIGMGGLGQAMVQVLAGFRPVLRAYDPWQAPSVTRRHGAEPADLETVLEQSDTVFVTAGVTSENKGFLGAAAFARMRKGAALILLSRADVVDFAALVDAVARGHIQAATDVWPVEPFPQGDRARTVPGLLKSAHRAGAMEGVFKAMGEMLLEDMALMDRGLPPQVCRRAERETVSRFRSMPVSKN